MPNLIFMLGNQILWKWLWLVATTYLSLNSWIGSTLAWYQRGHGFCANHSSIAQSRMLRELLELASSLAQGWFGREQLGYVLSMHPWMGSAVRAINLQDQLIMLLLIISYEKSLLLKYEIFRNLWLTFWRQVSCLFHLHRWQLQLTTNEK